MVRPKNGKINCDGKERRKKKRQSNILLIQAAHILYAMSSIFFVWLCTFFVSNYSHALTVLSHRGRSPAQNDSTMGSVFFSLFFFSVCVCRLNDSYRLPHRVVWHTHNLCVIDSREVKKNQQAIGLYFFLLLSFSLLWSFHVEWKPLQIRIQYRGEDIKCIYVLVVFASVFNFVFIML